MMEYSCLGDYFLDWILFQESRVGYVTTLAVTGFGKNQVSG